jgi:hypothetical protein
MDTTAISTAAAPLSCVGLLLTDYPFEDGAGLGGGEIYAIQDRRRHWNHCVETAIHGHIDGETVVDGDRSGV